MNAASIEPSALIDALRVETAGYRALITVLEAERDALRAADPDALAALAAAPDGTVVRREWSSLLVLAGTARGLNDVNGRLIANQQRHFDAALQSLLQAAGVPPVYGADGRPQRLAAVRARAAA